MFTETQILQKGRYRIVRTLRQYETGSVYQAVDTESGTGVLLREFLSNSGKVMTPAVLEARRAEFARKGQMLVALRNDTILEVKEFFTEIDRHYLVTESVEGATLGELIEKNKRPFSLTDVARWTDRLLDALIYLHDAQPQVVHGGVKPSTIRLSSDRSVKLLVFNLADETPERSDAAAAKAFDPAAIPYLPLEQIWNGLDPASQKVILTNYDERAERMLEQPVDSRGDLFALAATAYHLLTARIPIDALTRSIEILEGGDDPLKPPHSINPAIPIEVSDVLMTALEIRRENRFESSVEMRQMWRSTLKQAHERAKRQKTPLGEVDAVAKMATEPVVPTPESSRKSPELLLEHARQLEVMKAQLRAAESMRLDAEERAADAERRLRRAETLATFVPLEIPDGKASDGPLNGEPESMSETDREMVAEFSHDNLPGLFNHGQKPNGGVRKAVAAAVGLIVLAIGGLAVWQFTLPSGKADQQSVEATNNIVLPIPSTEATVLPIAETDPSGVGSLPEGTTPQPLEPIEKENPALQSDPLPTEPTVKPKSAVPQTAQVKKPAPTPVKSQAPKKVTLDDLLKDN